MSDATLLLIAPELAAVDEQRRLDVLELAEIQTGNVFGDARDLAVSYLAAHMLTLANRGGSSGGAVSSVKEGDLQVSYAGGQSNDMLTTTQYGQELIRLRKQYIFTARTSRVRKG